MTEAPLSSLRTVVPAKAGTQPPVVPAKAGTHSILLAALLVLFALLGCETEEDQLVKSATRGNIASRVGAIEKLSTHSSDKALKAVLVNLNHRNSLVRRTAARALRGKGIAAAWPLIHRLKDGDVRVRQVIVATLFTLPQAPFIHHALAGLIEDPSRQVRTAVVKGFTDAGFPLSDVLILLGHGRRRSALAGLASGRPEERAAAIRTFGELGTGVDLAFILPGLMSRDPFTYRSALAAMAYQPDPTLPALYLKLPATEQRNISILRWLTLQSAIDEAQWKQLLASGIDTDFLISLLPPRHSALPCALLPLVNKRASLAQFAGRACPVPANLDLSRRVILVGATGKALPEDLIKAVGAALPSLSGEALGVLLKKNLLREATGAMITAKWDRFLFAYTKWIPGSTWEKLSLVGPTDLKPQTTAKMTPREKLLSAYRSKVNVHTATELLPPRFDLPLFIRQVRAMRGEKALYPLLLKISASAPPELQTAALSAITGLKGAVPQEITAASESENPEVRKAAIAILASAVDIGPALRWFSDPEPDIRELVIEAIERTGSPAGLKLVTALFAKAPTARLAEVLGRLKVKKVLPELLSLMKEDTARAMDKDRAAVLASLVAIAPSNLDVRLVIGEERLHPSHEVQCTALSVTTDAKLRGIYATYSPYLAVRRCASGKTGK